MAINIKFVVNGNKPIRCCSEYDGMPQFRYQHQLCSYVGIPEADPFFHNPDTYSGNHCINYVRSVPAMNSDCTFGPKEQVRAL